MRLLSKLVLVAGISLSAALPATTPTPACLQLIEDLRAIVGGPAIEAFRANHRDVWRRASALLEDGKIRPEEMLALARELRLTAEAPTKAHADRLAAFLDLVEHEPAGSGWERLSGPMRGKVLDALSQGKITFEEYRALRAALSRPELLKFWETEATGGKNGLDTRVQRFLDHGDPKLPRTLIDPTKDFADHEVLRDFYSMTGPGSEATIKTFFRPLDPAERTNRKVTVSATDVEAPVRARLVDALGPIEDPVVQTMKRIEANPPDARIGALMKAYLAQTGPFALKHLTPFNKMLAANRATAEAVQAARGLIEAFRTASAGNDKLVGRATEVLRDLDAAKSPAALQEWVKRYDGVKGVPQEIRKAVDRVKNALGAVDNLYKAAVAEFRRIAEEDRTPATAKQNLKTLIEALDAYKDTPSDLANDLERLTAARQDSEARSQLQSLLRAPNDTEAAHEMKAVVDYLLRDPKLKDVPRADLEKLLLAYYDRARAHSDAIRGTIPSPEYRGFPFGFSDAAEYRRFVGGFQGIAMERPEGKKAKSGKITVFGSSQNGSNFMPKDLPGTDPRLKGIRPFRDGSDIDIAVDVTAAAFRVLEKAFKTSRDGFKMRTNTDPPYFQPLHLVFDAKGKLVTDPTQSDLLKFRQTLEDLVTKGRLEPDEIAGLQALRNWVFELQRKVEKEGAFWQQANQHREMKLSFSLYGPNNGVLGAQKAGRFYQEFGPVEIDEK